MALKLKEMPAFAKISLNSSNFYCGKTQKTLIAPENRSKKQFFPFHVPIR
jgi:hypothetical protein